MTHKIHQEHLKERAKYHNQCITKYLIGVKPDNDDPNSYVHSYNETAFTKLVNDISDDLMINKKKVFLMSSLLEKFSHTYL